MSPLLFEGEQGAKGLQIARLRSLEVVPFCLNSLSNGDNRHDYRTQTLTRNLAGVRRTGTTLNWNRSVVVQDGNRPPWSWEGAMGRGWFVRVGFSVQCVFLKAVCKARAG